MFSGIVEKKEKVIAVDRRGENMRVTIAKPSGWKLSIGQSVNVDGICSTVISQNAKQFSVEYMPETISKTTAGSLRKGSIVNLERSLRLGSFVDGHLVQGHVDARTKIANVSQNKDGHLVSVSLPKELLLLAAEHGSIAINGVSLTIARIEKSRITVALIPHTLAHTNLGELKSGDEVNIEADLFARYCENILSRGRLPHAKRSKRS